MEEVQQQQSSYQSSTGDYVAISQSGSATVNINMPASTLRWLKPVRMTLANKPFVGRQALVDSLIEDITTGKNIAITGKHLLKAFQGMGGIGKTYLAVKLAMELYDHFPGGVIRIDVGPQVNDESSAQVPLGRLASYALGGFPPLGSVQPEQVATWLNETAPGPFLVIFDGLWSPAPLRLLSRALPPQASLLVTTRFANVAQAIGATIVQLDRLSAEDGLAFLEDRLDCQGNLAYRSSLEKLVQLLGGHALALEIACAQIKRPTRLATVLQELDQGIGQGKLSNLKIDQEDGRDENLECSLALSYEHLTSEQQRLFCSLGVFAEESLITADAAAKIWSLEDVNLARKLLYELTDVALLNEVEEVVSDAVFRQHSLLRLYARALMDQSNELAEVSGLHAQFYTVRSRQAMSSSPPDYEFLDQHLPNILAALQWSEQNDIDLFPSLLDAIEEFLLLRGQTVLLETYLPKAIAITTHMEDKLKAANLLTSLGDLAKRLGNLDQARAHYDTALLLYRAIPNHLGEGRILRSLGDLERRLGNLDQARTHYNAALLLYREISDRLGEASVLMFLGILESRLDNLDQACTHYNAALLLYRAIPDHLGEANVLTNLGDLESQLENLDRARTHYDAALLLYRAILDHLGEAHIFRRLGDLESQLGNLDQARAHYEVTLPLYHAQRYSLGEAHLLMSLGDLERRLGNLDQARTHYDAALLLYRVIPDHLGEAHIYKRLGDLESQLGNLDQARVHYNAALPLYRSERNRSGEAHVNKMLGDMFTA